RALSATQRRSVGVPPATAGRPRPAGVSGIQAQEAVIHGKTPSGETPRRTQARTPALRLGPRLKKSSCFKTKHRCFKTKHEWFEMKHACFKTKHEWFETKHRWFSKGFHAEPRSRGLAPPLRALRVKRSLRPVERRSKPRNLAA